LFYPGAAGNSEALLNQAKIDSIEVSETQVIQEVDRWVNYAINQVGSKEKLEEYFNNMKLSQIKEERKERFVNNRSFSKCNKS
jgi:peptidyl-prolyl cis-trans isomerase SurA